MSQVDNRNSSAGKRARTDGGRREDDWTCPSCGNVNFSFRTTCNMRNCNQSRPADHYSKPVPKPMMQTPPRYATPAVGGGGGYMGSGQLQSSMYLSPSGGGPPYGSSLFNGPPLPPYDHRHHLPPYASGGSAYPPPPYGYSGRLSVASPYPPLHLSGPPPYSPSIMGGMYGMAPLADRYGSGLPTGHASLGGRPGSYSYPDEISQKKASGGGRDDDWKCPTCGNINFSFRTICNMRKCNTHRPDNSASKSESSKNSKQKMMPEGSWKCENCGNINYPFRTKCNRQNCGADKPSDPTTTDDPLSDDHEEQ